MPVGWLCVAQWQFSRPRNKMLGSMLQTWEDESTTQCWFASADESGKERRQKGDGAEMKEAARLGYGNEANVEKRMQIDICLSQAGGSKGSLNVVECRERIFGVLRRSESESDPSPRHFFFPRPGRSRSSNLVIFFDLCRNRGTRQRASNDRIVVNKSCEGLGKS
ncbi:hypothetical protein L209DRAFT_571978 [Thermothelomyces heterothallicus CBS 203.75]